MRSNPKALPDRTDRSLVLPLWQEILQHPDSGTVVDALISHPAAAELVAEIPDQDLYQLIKHVGMADVGELIGLATPEQFRSFLDLDGWHQDNLNSASILPWLRALAAANPTEVATRVERLDLELVSLLLRQLVVIHLIEPEEEPPVGDRIFYVSPDRSLALEAISQETQDVAEILLTAEQELLGPLGLVRLLIATLHELPTALSEDALRWRNGRLADLGFVPWDEARTLYFPLPPDTWKHPTGPASREPESPLPRWLARRTAGPLLQRAMAELDAATHDRVEQDLVYLANALMAAGSIDPGDEEAVAAVLRRGRGYLEIALARLGGDDAQRGAALLQEHSVRTLFRWTNTRLLELRRRALQLRPAQNQLSLAEQAQLNGWLQQHPRRPDGGEFQQPEQLTAAEQELRLLEDQATCIRCITRSCHAGEPPSAMWLAIFGSGLARRILGHTASTSLELDATTAQEFLATAFQQGQLTAPLRQEIRSWLGELLADADRGCRLAEHWCHALTEELGGLDPSVPIDRRFVTGLILAPAQDHQPEQQQEP